MKHKEKKLLGIAKIIRLVKSEDNLVRFLDDILTESEIDNMHERTKIVACLKNGLSQRATQKETEAAIATVSRGANLMQKPKLILDKIVTLAENMAWWNKLFWRV